MTATSLARESQDFGAVGVVGRRDDGRTGLARHYTSPGNISVAYATIGEPYDFGCARQRQVVGRRKGISPYFQNAAIALAFASSLQPFGVAGSFCIPLNAPVASDPSGSLSGVSRPASPRPAHPPVRSRSSFFHLSSPREGCIPRHPYRAPCAVSAFHSSTPASPARALADVSRAGNVDRRLCGTQPLSAEVSS